MKSSKKRAKELLRRLSSSSLHKSTNDKTTALDSGEGAVKKPVGWATNAPYIAEQAAAQCSNCCKHMVHRHIHLFRGKAEAAELKLCLAASRGLTNQNICDGRMDFKYVGIVTCEEVVTDEGLIITHRLKPITITSHVSF